jgi:hypothetical protein
VGRKSLKKKKGREEVKKVKKKKLIYN